LTDGDVAHNNASDENPVLSPVWQTVENGFVCSIAMRSASSTRRASYDQKYFKH
jgi:hypothetical protein